MNRAMHIIADKRTQYRYDICFPTPRTITIIITTSNFYSVYALSPKWILGSDRPDVL